MRPAETIWNRACAEAGGPKWLTAPGDRALADLVLAHSLAMNGGVLHAVESLSADKRWAAIHGYRYFGLGEVAEVLDDMARRVEGHLSDDAAELLEAEADDRYGAVIADDESLIVAVAERFRREPTAFAAP